MKTIHHLKASWLLLAMIAGVAVGETLAWFVTSLLQVRFPPLPVAALSIGAVAAFVAWKYDGTE